MATPEPIPAEKPRAQAPPISGTCRVWQHRPGELVLLGDYAEHRPKHAAVAAFDQVEGRRRRTFVVMDAGGEISAWSVSSDRGAA